MAKPPQNKLLKTFAVKIVEHQMEMSEELEIKRDVLEGNKEMRVGKNTDIYVLTRKEMEAVPATCDNILAFL